MLETSVFQVKARRIVVIMRSKITISSAILVTQNSITREAPQLKLLKEKRLR
jgi:hypothetical protein